MTPLKKYRGRCLWVSDLMKQFWCEQFMVFGYELPCDVVENPVIKAGESIHLARGECTTFEPSNTRYTVQLLYPNMLRRGVERIKLIFVLSDSCSFTCFWKVASKQSHYLGN